MWRCGHGGWAKGMREVRLCDGPTAEVCDVLLVQKTWISLEPLVIIHCSGSIY